MPDRPAQPPSDHGARPIDAGLRARAGGPVRLGMGPNWRQFTLLSLMTFLVGMTIGVERVVLPPLAHHAFGITSLELTVSFVSAFGAVKAVLNMVAGHWSDRLGRRRLMAAGWALGLPYPLLIAFAPSWGWVVVANLFLGANQGLTWTTSVTAKIDLVGPVRRGLAVGIDEAAGYVGTAVGGYAAGLIAASSGLRPAPYWLALGTIVLGGALTLWPVRDTLPWAKAEAAQRPARQSGGQQAAPSPSLARLMAYMSFRDRAMFAACQAGTINKFADALVIGLVPLWLISHHVSVATVGLVSGVYTAVWGILQIPSGQAADHLGRKPLIVGGLIVEGLAVAWFVAGHGLATWLGAAVVMGIGTAALYPNLITAVSDISHPAWRGGSLGVYRLWRDGGYAIGPLITAGLADGFGLAAGFWFVAALLVASGLAVAVLMDETDPRRRRRPPAWERHPELLAPRPGSPRSPLTRRDAHRGRAGRSPGPGGTLTGTGRDAHRDRAGRSPGEGGAAPGAGTRRRRVAQRAGPVGPRGTGRGRLRVVPGGAGQQQHRHQGGDLLAGGVAADHAQHRPVGAS